MQLFERAGELLGHDRHRGDQYREERQHKPEGARDHERRAVQLGVEHRSRDDLNAGCRGRRRGGQNGCRSRASHLRHLLGQHVGDGRTDQTAQKPFGVAGQDRFTAVVDQLNLRQLPPARRGAQIPVEVRRDDDGGADRARHQSALELAAGPVGTRIKGAFGAQLRHQAAAGAGAVAVENAERQPFDFGRQDVTEEQAAPRVAP